MIWRGIQDLLTICLFPNNPIVSCLICIIIGVVILIIDDWKIDELSEHVDNNK